MTEKIVPLAEVDCDCCCVSADGTMVHSDGEWHEVRVGTVRSVRGDITLKSSIARFVDVERFGADLWRKACQYGYQQASVKAFISDGSHWIWSLAAMHFPEAVNILDWYHLAEHISKCGNELFGEGSKKSRRWASRMRQLLREGKVQHALRKVERIRVRCQAQQRAKHELITCLMNPAVGGAACGLSRVSLPGAADRQRGGGNPR